VVEVSPVGESLLTFAWVAGACLLAGLGSLAGVALAMRVASGRARPGDDGEREVPPSVVERLVDLESQVALLTSLPATWERIRAEIEEAGVTIARAEKRRTSREALAERRAAAKEEEQQPTSREEQIAQGWRKLREKRRG